VPLAHTHGTPRAARTYLPSFTAYTHAGTPCACTQVWNHTEGLVCLGLVGRDTLRRVDRLNRTVVGWHTLRTLIFRFWMNDSLTDSRRRKHSPNKHLNNYTHTPSATSLQAPAFSINIHYWQGSASATPAAHTALDLRFPLPGGATTCLLHAAYPPPRIPRDLPHHTYRTTPREHARWHAWGGRGMLRAALSW